MKIAALACIALLPLAAAAADPLEDELIAMEKASWVAWKAHDSKFYETFLSDDHLEIHGMGVGGKGGVVALVAAAACTVESYTVDHWEFRRLSADSALLNYRAEQKTTCAGVAVPSPVRATSVFARRDGHWVNVLYQHSAVPK